MEAIEIWLKRQIESFYSIGCILLELFDLVFGYPTGRILLSWFVWMLAVLCSFMAGASIHGF